MTIKCKSAGLSYFEHWIREMRERREEHLEAEGPDTTLDDFKAWHRDEYGYGTQYGTWQENELDKFLVDTS